MNQGLVNKFRAYEKATGSKEVAASLVLADELAWLKAETSTHLRNIQLELNSIRDRLDR